MGRYGARTTLEGARAIREFAVLAEREGIEWNLVEAIDQPWKSNEGHVGPHWGVLDVDFRPKTPLVGPVSPEAREAARLALGPLIGLGLGPLFWRWRALAVAGQPIRLRCSRRGPDG